MISQTSMERMIEEMKRILSLLIAMIMALSCVGISAMAETVNTLDELLNAIENGDGNITLGADIDLNGNSYVAYIGEQGYETVQAAINAAKKDETVTICAGEYGAIDISNKSITIQGTVSADGELLTTLTGNDPVITGHGFNGTIKDLKIGECWKVMYAEPAGNVTIDNVYVTKAMYGFHLVAYSPDLTWKIENSYMNLSWANSFGVSYDGDADIVIKGNKFEATDPYNGGDVYPVNSYLPSVTVEENIFGEDTRISIENVTDTSKINISKNYHADGVDNAFDSGSVTVPIKSYYTDVDADGNLSGLVEIVDAVAEVNGVEYPTLEEAFKAANSGDEIVLLANVEGNITVPADVIFNGNGFTVNGGIIADGDITFAGVTKAKDFDAKYADTTINIGSGATLELTGSDRMVIGHGATFNIEGNITDAKTANTAELTPSLIAPGASFTGAGVNFNVTNAYVKFTAYCSSKNSNASGTYNINVTNSVWEQTGSLVFSEPTNGKDPTFNFNVKDSVLNSTSHLVFAVTKGDIVFDNSNVNVGVYRQLENRSTLTIKNGSVVYAAHATSSNAKNPGTTIVDNATYTTTGEFSGSDLGTGTLIVKNGAKFSTGKITKANITIDAAGLSAGEVDMIAADLSKFEGTVCVVNNNLEAKIEDGKIVLVTKPVAKIGDTEYATLEEAFKAATDGCTIEILDDVVIDYKWDCRDYATNGSHSQFKESVTINGNNKKIKFTGEVNDGNWNTVFRFEENATVKNLTIDVSEATGVQRGISSKLSITAENCKFIGNGTSSKRAIIFGEGAGDALSNVTATIKGCTFTNWSYGVSDNQSGKDAKSVSVTGSNFDNASALVSASEAVTFTGNTVDNGYVNIKSYTADNTCNVTAIDNTLDLTKGEDNKIDAGGEIEAQEGFYTPVVLPNATVSKLEPLTLEAGSYMVWPSGATDIDRPLEIVMNFKTNETTEEARPNGFLNWKVDFYLDFEGLATGSIKAENCYLAGNYGSFGWIVIPTDDLVIEEGITYPVVAAYDANITYKQICDEVKNFTAAIHVDQAILDANPNFKVKLSLKMTNPNDASDPLVIGDPAVYTAEDLKNEKAVASIGTKKYSSLTDAIAAAQADDTITLLDKIELSETVTVPAGKTITLDLAGKTITGTDNNTSGNFYLISVNKGNLTVIDNVGGGEITLTATNERNWNSSSVVIANNQGTLTVNGGAIEHLGGTSMAYGIDNLTNGDIGAATTTINGGSVDSTYFAVRQFANSATTMNTVEITGGDVGYVWMQSPNNDVNTATTTVTGGTVAGICVSGVNADYTLSALASSLGESGIYGTMPAGKVLAEVDGIYTLEEEKEEVELFEFGVTSVTLGNSLTVNFYVDAENIVDEDYYAVIKHFDENGTKEETIHFSNWETRTTDGVVTSYVIPYKNLAARQMTDRIEVTIYNADGTPASVTKTDSLREYALRGINTYAGKSGLTDAQNNVLTALVDMLNYGAAAQMEFNYRKEELANAATDTFQKYATSDISDVQNIQEKDDNYSTTTLVLKNNIVLTAYFKNVTEGMYAVYKFTDHYGNEKSKRVDYESFVVNSRYGHGVDVAELVIADAGQPVTITMYNADGSVYSTLVDSMNSYLRRAMNVMGEDSIYGKTAKFTKAAYRTLH